MILPFTIRLNPAAACNFSCIYINIIYFLVIGRLNCAFFCGGADIYIYIYLFIYIYLCMSNKAQDAPQSVGLLRTSDRSVSEIST